VEFVASTCQPANNFTIHILAAVAEQERRPFPRAPKAALAAAKARGVQLGGDRGNLPAVARKGREASSEVRQQKAMKPARDLAAMSRNCRQQGRTSLRQNRRRTEPAGDRRASGRYLAGRSVASLIRRLQTV